MLLEERKFTEQHDNPSSLSVNTNLLFSFGIKNILMNAGLSRDICDELLSFHHGSTQLITHLALLFSFSLFSVLLWIHVDLMMWRNKLKHAAANGSRHHTTVSFRRYKSAIWKSIIETWYGISLVLQFYTKSNTEGKFISRIFQFRHMLSN